jgi:hypothetical protein
MRVDEVGPLVDVGELVGGGEVDARLPFLLADALADGGLDSLGIALIRLSKRIRGSGSYRSTRGW